MGIGEEGAIGRGLEWLVGMQSDGGGWGAFDVDNKAMWLYKIPFCDFGKVTDEPSADVTAHALETLGHEVGYDDAKARGLDWLLGEQERDGSWFGRWGVNHLYGTGAALPALEACGVPHDDPAVRRAVAWLDSVQQESGGFGEDIRSYADPRWRGSTPCSRRTAASGRTSAPTATRRGAGGPNSRPLRRPPGRYSAMWPQETLKIRAVAGRQTISAPRSARTVIGMRSISPAQDSHLIS